MTELPISAGVMTCPLYFADRATSMKITLLVLALAISTGTHAQAQSPSPDTLSLTLPQAIDRSLEVSPEVGIQQAEEQFARGRLAEARASRFLTEFSLQTAHAAAPGLTGFDEDFDTEELYLNPDVRNDWEEVRPYNQFEVNILQPLYTWGQLSGSRRAARHGIEVEETETRSTELAVAMRTAEIYYNILLAERLEALTDEAEETLAEAERELNRLLDEGDPDVAEADLFQLEITEQEIMRQVAEVTEQGALARSAFNRQLFLPDHQRALPDETILEPLPFPEQELEELIEIALMNRPEQRQAEAGRAARSALVDVAESDYYPKLFMGFSTSYSFAEGRYRQPNPYVGDPFRGRSLRVGLGVRQELNFFRTRARVDQAKAELREVEYQQEAAGQLIAFEVEEAYRAARQRRADMESRRASVRISGEWLRTEQINFDLDVGDADNLIGAVQTNLELQAVHFESIRAYNVAVLRLLQSIGILPSPDRIGMLVDLSG